MFCLSTAILSSTTDICQRLDVTAYRLFISAMIKVFFIIIFLVLPLSAHEKPWKVTGSFMYSEGRALEAHLFTSLSLIQETFDIETLRDDFYSVEMEENIRKWILHVRTQFIEIRENNIPIEAFIKSISIVPDEDADSNLPPGKFALKDVDISISFLFSTDEAPSMLAVKWLYTPEPLLDLLRLEGKRIMPDDSEIPVTFTANDIRHYKVSAENPSFKWKNSAVPLPEIIPEQQRILKHSGSGRNTFLIIFSVFALTIIAWAFISNPKIRNAVETGVVICGCGIIGFSDSGHKKEVIVRLLPEQSKLEQMISRRLTNIYRGTSSSTPEILFSRLQKAAEGEFLTETFTRLFKSKAEHSDTVQIIEKVNLEKCRISGGNEVECSWTVKAYILHLGHVHEKDLHYKAVFSLGAEFGKWLIKSGNIIPVFKEEKT